jgi:hypothetical protein
MFSEPMAATTELRPAKTDRQPDAQSRPALQADVVAPRDQAASGRVAVARDPEEHERWRQVLGLSREEDDCAMPSLGARKGPRRRQERSPAEQGCYCHARGGRQG